MSASLQPGSASPTPPPILSTEAQSYTRYVARQPILDRELNTHGYELLFRSGPENFFHAANPDVATCNTIDFSMLFGSPALTRGLPAYINCTRKVLLEEVITVMPRDRVVVEVLEDVVADPEVMAACARLRRAGYLIALDDYVPTPETSRLLAFADIVKVDFLATDVPRQAAIATEMRQRGIRLLAEKIESREQFELALRLGYQYFQGYFFSRPQTVTMQDVPCSHLSYIQVLNIANRDYYEVSELEQAILREPSLCYRLLRYLNSAAFGVFPVRSIRHALSLLGQREIQKWVSIVVAIAIATDRPGELIYNALVRARHCESMAALTGASTNSAFMVGLMSLMDAILDRPMDVVLAQLPLAPDCKQALRGRGEILLGQLLQLSIACERGEWEQITTLLTATSIEEAKLWESYRDACRWSGEILKESGVSQ